MLFKGMPVFANLMPRAFENQLEDEMSSVGLRVDSRILCSHSHTYTHTPFVCKK